MGLLLGTNTGASSDPLLIRSEGTGNLTGSQYNDSLVKGTELQRKFLEVVWYVFS